MSTDSKILELAEAYINGKLDETGQAALRTRLAQDQAFATEFNDCVNMLRSLQDSGKQKRFRSVLVDIRQSHTAKNTTKGLRTISLRSYYFRTAAIAAGIALLTSITTYWAIQHSNKKIASQYSLLRRDLEKYKSTQNKLINDINDQRSKPALPARYSGTGFAITNDGYIVTNYHVTEGADSIYIQDNEGRYFKASVKTFDQATDVAILKIEDKHFRFAKGEVPYTLAALKSGLGAHVYSLGFPEDQVIYNEGYISARNGYSGDSMQYRLEMPANPGQSGAPVVDAKGNVVAIITGKESEQTGTTYAVSSKAVLQLIRSLPKDESIRLTKVNKLGKLKTEDQVAKMENYTCAVKVYKK